MNSKASVAALFSSVHRLCCRDSACLVGWVVGWLVDWLVGAWRVSLQEFVAAIAKLASHEAKTNT